MIGKLVYHDHHGMCAIVQEEPPFDGAIFFPPDVSYIQDYKGRIHIIKNPLLKLSSAEVFNDETFNQLKDSLRNLYL